MILSEDTAIKDNLINEQIRAREVRLLSSTGDQLGVMSNSEARMMAANQGMDLVLISNQGNCPVCKIMDYGKFKYDQVKKAKETKRNQKLVETKEVWLSPTIDTNDMNTKAKGAIKFLEGGDKVKVSIRLKGRYISRPENGVKVINEFYEMCKAVGVSEKSPNLEGRCISMVIGPIKKI